MTTPTRGHPQPIEKDRVPHVRFSDLGRTEGGGGFNPRIKPSTSFRNQPRDEAALNSANLLTRYSRVAGANLLYFRPPPSPPPRPVGPGRMGRRFHINRELFRMTNSMQFVIK